MSYNIPEEERPQANKKAQEGLNILASDVNSTLNRVKNLQQGTIADEYNKPVDAPIARTLSPIEQYIYEPQPVVELGGVSEPLAEESMVVPQDQPKVLSNFVNQYESVPQRDMVSVTPYEQAVVDLRQDQVDSLRNDAGEISASSLEVFSKPLDANKVKILGFVDDEMKPTKKGQLFYNLKNMGMFNDDGTITEKGIAYMTPLDEMAVPEWIEQPGNVEKFDLLWQDGVIRSSSTPTEILGAVTKFAGDVVYGAGELAQQQALGLAYNSRTWGGLLGLEDNRPAALKAQSDVSELSVMENVYKNVVNLATMIDVGFATDKKLIEEYVMSPIGAAYEKVTGDEFPELRATDRSNPNVKDSEDALIAARHKQWAANQRLADMEAGEIAETFLGVENSVKQAESLKKQIGDDEFKKIYGGVGAFTSVALDPTNAVPAAFAVKASRAAPLASRALLNAQKTMGKVAAMELAIAQGDIAVQAARATLAKVEPTVGLANRMAQSFAERAKVQPNLVEKAQTAANIARRVTDEANQIKSALPAITTELEGLIAKRNSLATRIPEAYSQKVLQTMAIGRQARALPAKALGATLERVGDTISKADTAITNFLQERGLDQIYTAAVGAAGVVGVAGSPVIGTVAAGAAALKSGKVLSSYGKLFRYVGKEMENVRGQIPFWKRVAAHTAPGSLGRGIAHTFNAFDLGGVTSDTIRRTGRGIVAAAPSDIMFEYLSDGADMRPETLYQAGAESFVIGGSFAAAGGAFMGTKKRMRELSIGDEINFRRNLIDPRQKALFQAIPSSTRRSISTYAIANPTLNYVFNDSGISRYDPNTNTAIINVNSTNPIKALVAHETLHHTIVKNNMEAGIAALFLGDTKGNATGGLFRSKDGTLDPNFEAFKDAYYKRLGAEGMTNAERDAIYPLDKIAVEYFIEKHADQYASMAESGALGAVSSSGAARRKLGSILETVLPRVPVLKDLHFKSGGMIDANGSWVTGNGLLDAEGVRRDPITSKMFRDMNRRSSGLAPGQFDPLMSDKPDSGAPILLDPANGIDAELLHPLVNVDANGKPILQNGKPVALDRATELSRALGGMTAIEAMRRKRAENYAPEKGEAHIDSEGEFQPGWLSNDVITEMFAKNNYNSEQKRIIREMNRLIKKGAGERVVMINFPATGRNKAGKVVYKSQEATLRDTVPVAVTISKTGNLLFGLMSVTKLNENIQKRAQSKRGKKLYGGNVDLILRDTQAMMDFHKNGVDSIEFFKEKYGAVEADERKKFINTMFGLLNKKEQAVFNPMLLEDGVKSRDNVYRTYRADRVSKAVPMSPEEYPAMPFSYEAVSQVKMPEQMRQMPEGEKVPVAEVMRELDSTNFIPTNLAAGILGAFPEYLLPVAGFIANQRTKLVSGSLTSRDIWKAYAVTVASQGTGAVGVDTLKSKLANEGINFDPPSLFTDKGKAGQDTIRPEEAAAYWLGTEAGKLALDNAEAGKTTAADWEELVRIRKAYGDDRFKTFNVFSEKNLSKIPVVVDKLNSSKGDSKQVLEAVQLLNGVSTGKKGFISHLLGLGDTPTIDAVEINFWLTGKGDVGTLKTKEADLARRVKNTFSDKRVREEMFRRVDDSIQALQGSVEGGDKIPRDVWAHIVHHWLWDKAKGLETTHKGMYEAQARYMPEPVAKNKVAQAGKEKQNKQETNGPTKKDGKGRIYQRSIRDEPDVGRKFAEGITRTASEHPMGSAVEVKDASFYDDPDTKLFLAQDNLTGVAVTSYGDLVSVFKHPTSKEKILPILEEAAEYARTLDAYDINGFLPTLYSKVGFRPVARIAFDSEFVPKTWPYDLAGTPDVVLMVKDPEGLSGAPQIGDEGYNAIRDQVPMYATYDEAMDAQQKAIESINRLSAPVNPAAPDVEFKKPLSRDEPLPDIDDTVIDDAVDVDGFAFDRPAKVYMQHPGGGRTYFNYDPAYLIKPEFKGLRATLEGKNVIILEADKMRATGGDMGGALHPFLRSNQVVVRGSDGKLYKAVWANMNSSFVTRTKNRWFDDKAEYALIHLMDDVAHSSNKRVARIMEEAWEKANLSNYEQRMVSVAMQAAITAQQKASYSQKITQTQKKIKEGDYTTAEIKEFNDLIKQHTKDRDALSWTGIDEQIAKKITQIKSSQTSLQNKTGTQASVDKAKKALRDFLDENPAHLAAFNSISNKTASLKISDNIGDTFKSRGAAIQGLLGIVFNKFNPSDLLKKTEDFQGSENMDLVAAVQLSKNKDIFAVYFGKDPNEEAAMSASERDVRDKLRADPNFVEHEAFDWMMLGPENADNFLAESSLKPEELIPEYRNKHEKASVKTGSEETVLGAMKMFAGIPLKVVKKTQAQLDQFAKKRNERLSKRKAEKARKEEIKKISNKLKSRDANLEKLATQIASASEKPLLKSLKLKAAEVKKDRNALARQITKLQNMN